MVRAKYPLNPERGDVLLEALFGLRQGGKAIDRDMAVDWSRFLDTSQVTIGGRGRVPAMAIDTTMVRPLFHLHDTRVHHFSDLHAPPLPAALAVRTLQRGASTRLATGEEVSRALGLVPLRERGLKGGDFSWMKLDELKLTGRTPLWYYVLLEAEMECTGVRLGAVGSQLVAEVIEGCLRTDPTSYLSCFGSSWEPPPWNCLAEELGRSAGSLIWPW